MRIGFLGAATSWYYRDVLRAAEARHEVCPIPFSTLGATLATAQHRARSGFVELDQFDVLLVRSMPPGSLEQVILRMDVLGQYHERGGVVVNPPRSLEVAIDKYLSLSRLQQAGLRVPDTVVCQTTEEAVEAFQQLGGDVVLKPLFGGEGRGITRLVDPDLAARAFHLLSQLGAVLYLQQFIDHAGSDLRLFVVGSKTFGMQRRNPLDWRTNVSRGATTETLEMTEPVAAMARAAVDAVGAEMAAVDILPDKSGNLWVLEVNAVPGWRALARTTGVDIAREVLEYLETRCRTKKLARE